MPAITRRKTAGVWILLFRSGLCGNCIYGGAESNLKGKIL
jgi:hypothetical protein